MDIIIHATLDIFALVAIIYGIRSYRRAKRRPGGDKISWWRWLIKGG